MKHAFLLLGLALFFAACSGEPVADKSKQDQNSEPVKVTEKKEPTAEELAAIQAQKEKEEAERKLRESAEQLTKLNEDFAKANQEWMNARNSIRDAAASQSHFDSRPCLKYAEDLVVLAESYPESPAAEKAWGLALKWGMGEPKFKAADHVLATAKAESDLSKSMKMLEDLMAYATGAPQKEAMQLMLDSAKEDMESEESFQIIKKLVSSRKGMVFGREGYILVNGNEEVRQQAIKELKLIVQSDIKSAKAIECLNLMYRNGDESTQDVAIQQLLQHHLTDESTMQLVQSLGRRVTSKNEKLLKGLTQNANAIAKANALVALSQLYSRKQLEAQYYATAPEEQVQNLGEDKLAYLKAGTTAEDLALLESELSSYVEGHKSILASAEKELFALQNLAIGKTAPEIVGDDLDGVEFKLSDYRGKVVFLDFWGDW